MSAVSIIGNFGSRGNELNGQTVKTKIVSKQLVSAFGKDQVKIFDTSERLKTLLTAPYIAFAALCRSRDVVIFPAHNAVRVFVPLLVLFQNLFNNRRIHYVVIGGWLPSFIVNKPVLRHCLHKVFMIYAETHSMESDLERMGYSKNVSYMPNCKALQIIGEDELSLSSVEPLRLCTFSRVWSMKGVSDAVDAVKAINENNDRIVYSLDIYGMVEKGEEQWFNDLQSGFPKYIRYCGAVPFDGSVGVLKNYFGLLFPTRCPGEGIPGTIIDAYAAGLPVISSLYPNYGEVVDDGVTGLGYKFCDISSLIILLDEIANNPNKILELKRNCLKKAKSFQPDSVVKVLIDNISRA